jgi:hypothetical protein
VLLILLGVAGIAWRVCRWNQDKIHFLYLGYLVTATLIGILLFNVPNMVTRQGINWWVDYCQPNVFYGLISWYVFSIVSMYLAPKKYLIASCFGVFAPFLYLPGFLFMAEAGTLEALAPQFYLMKCLGITLGALSLGMLVVILCQKRKNTKLHQSPP